MAMNNHYKTALTEKVIGAAISVHRELGPGYLEAIYERAMCIALSEIGLKWANQVIVPVHFHGHCVGEHRLDLLVQNEVLVELKAISAFEDVHYAVVRSYLRASQLECGLLMNFAASTLQVKRIGPDFWARN